MPAIPREAPSASSSLPPVYVCYFNQTQGLVAATNCSQVPASTATTGPQSTWNQLWLGVTIGFSIVIYSCLVVYYIYVFIPMFVPNWRQKVEPLLRYILFWRPAPNPEPVSITPLPQRAPEPEPEPEPTPAEPGTQAYFDGIKKSCFPDELLLWDQITFPGKQNAGFDKVHLPSDTIEAVKTFGFPLLNRRSEFAYGILANNNIPGMLLYGPPGTGKTQLVKAMGQHYETRVLNISAGRMNTKWFGESERAVAAAFTLARRLSPCILFVDEADSILRRRRDDTHESETHRSVLSQFLLEWDGFGTDGDKPVLVVLATNRPSDLDDAVLRRAPKRIAVGIPTLKDRIAILNIHLQGEQLGPDVSIEGIARKTDKFTGSDLKNLCIAAAYACIFEGDGDKTDIEVEVKVDDAPITSSEVAAKDENVGVEEDEEHGEDIPLLSLSSHTVQALAPGSPQSLPSTTSESTLVSDPPRRLLCARHFEKAIKNITPTCASGTGMSFSHVFENGFLNDKLSQQPKITATTRRTFAIPSSRVPY